MSKKGWGWTSTQPAICWFEICFWRMRFVMSKMFMMKKAPNHHNMDVSKNKGVPQNGWFIMESPIKMDDLGIPLIFGNIHIYNLCSLHFGSLGGYPSCRPIEWTDRLEGWFGQSPKTKDKLITFRNPFKRTGVDKKYQLSLYMYMEYIFIYKYSEVQRCALKKNYLIPAPSKVRQLNPKVWLIDTL